MAAGNRAPLRLDPELIAAIGLALLLERRENAGLFGKLGECRVSAGEVSSSDLPFPEQMPTWLPAPFELAEESE